MRLHNLTSLSTTPQQMKNVFLLKGFKTAFLTFLLFAILGSQSVFGQYCTPTFMIGCDDFDRIENFSTSGGVINITNNNSGCSPGYYQYISGQSVSQYQGSDVSLSVQCGPEYQEGFKIWIDWNNNQSFADAGELVYSSGFASINVFNTVITVPSGASVGVKRMRVLCSYDDVPQTDDGCILGQYFGECEDYNFEVLGSANTPPTITAIADTVGCGTFGPLSFTIGDVETSAANLTLSAVAANPTLFPSSGITFGGSGANRTISLVAASGVSGVSNINVVVTDEAGAESFISFAVTVNPTPTITAVNDTTVCAGSSLAYAFSASSGSIDWSNSNTAIGLAASGSGNIASFATVNAGVTAATANISVTATANGCASLAENFTITVNPLPTVTNGSTQTVDHGAVVAAVATAGNMGSGATYAWTNSNASIGLAASGTGNVPQFTAANTTAIFKQVLLQFQLRQMAALAQRSLMKQL